MTWASCSRAGHEAAAGRYQASQRIDRGIQGPQAQGEEANELGQTHDSKDAVSDHAERDPALA